MATKKKRVSVHKKISALVLALLILSGLGLVLEFAPKPVLAAKDSSAGGRTVDIPLVQSNAEAREFFNLVNELRREHGVPELYWDNELEEATETRAWQTALDFGHEYEGRPFYDYDPTERADGENLVAGCSTAQEAFDCLKGSPGHLKNMLNPSFKGMNVTKMYSESNDVFSRWVQLFTRSEKKSGASEAIPDDSEDIVLEVNTDDGFEVEIARLWYDVPTGTYFTGALNDGEIGAQNTFTPVAVLKVKGVEGEDGECSVICAAPITGDDLEIAIITGDTLENNGDGTITVTQNGENFILQLIDNKTGEVLKEADIKTRVYGKDLGWDPYIRDEATQKAVDEARKTGKYVDPYAEPEKPEAPEEAEDLDLPEDNTDVADDKDNDRPLEEVEVILPEKDKDADDAEEHSQKRPLEEVEIVLPDPDKGQADFDYTVEDPVVIPDKDEKATDTEADLDEESSENDVEEEPDTPSAEYPNWEEGERGRYYGDPKERADLDNEYAYETVEVVDNEGEVVEEVEVIPETMLVYDYDGNMHEIPYREGGALYYDVYGNLYLEINHPDVKALGDDINWGPVWDPAKGPYDEQVKQVEEEQGLEDGDLESDLVEDAEPTDESEPEGDGPEFDVEEVTDPVDDVDPNPGPSEPEAAPDEPDGVTDGDPEEPATTPLTEDGEENEAPPVDVEVAPEADPEQDMPTDPLDEAPNEGDDLPADTDLADEPWDDTDSEP